MAKLRMDLTGNVTNILAIMKDNTVISVIVRFILVEILQQAENGLRAKMFGTVKTVTGYMIKIQLNV